MAEAREWMVFYAQVMVIAVLVLALGGALGWWLSRG